MPPYTNPAEHYLDFAAHPKPTRSARWRRTSPPTRGPLRRRRQGAGARGGGEAGAPAARRRCSRTCCSAARAPQRAQPGVPPRDDGADAHPRARRRLALPQRRRLAEGAQDRLGAMYFILTCQVMASSSRSARSSPSETSSATRCAAACTTCVRTTWRGRSPSRSCSWASRCCSGCSATAIKLAPTAAAAVFLATLARHARRRVVGGDDWCGDARRPLGRRRRRRPLALPRVGRVLRQHQPVPRSSASSTTPTSSCTARRPRRQQFSASPSPALRLVGPPPLPPPQRAIARLVGVRWPDPRCPSSAASRCSRRWRSTASRPRRIWRRSARSSSRTASSASSPSAAARPRGW